MKDGNIPFLPSPQPSPEGRWSYSLLPPGEGLGMRATIVKK